MTRIHDMGGRLGEGKISKEDENVKFKSKWEEEVFSLTIAMGFSGLWNLDTSRFARESLEPVDYLRFSYFEKWLAALINLLNENEVIGSPKEKNSESLKKIRKLEAKNVSSLLERGSPTLREGIKKNKFQQEKR